MGSARHWLLIRLRPCGAGPARVCFKARIPKPEMAAQHPRIHPAGRLANPNAPASRASAGGASSRLPASTLRVASQIRTPPHHAPALEGQAPACPPKDPRRPNTGKEDLAPPPCGSHRKSEPPRITRQRWRGKLPLARRRIHSPPVSPLPCFSVNSVGTPFPP